MTVGGKIKQYLQDNGISQTHVAEKIGMTRLKMNQALNGNRKVYAEELLAICKVLNVSPETFGEDVDNGQSA